MSLSPSTETPGSAEELIGGIIATLGSFVSATDALTGAIITRNAVAMSDALQRLGRARRQALALVGVEDVPV
jgi:hypothetical protein